MTKITKKNKQSKPPRVYKKCIVQTRGDYSFMLITPIGEEIKASRPTVVVRTDFVEQKQSDKVLKILATDLPLEASDREFAEILREAEGDIPFAVEAYCAEFGIDPFGEPLTVKE